ncbi:MAG: FAD:protein FMN transferase [Pirellulaceae bacterium]|nr:FAD:protein FMN transferase [Pirellulaceae bacterium]
MQRRGFLWGVGGGLVAALAGSAAVAPRFGSRPQPDNSTAAFETRTSRALGSDVSITVGHAEPRVRRQALDAAFAELELVESLMSIYRPDSQLSRLNRDGVLERPHPYLLEVLQAASGIAARTQGAFDVTVQPLWALYRQAQTAGRLPSESAVRQARAQVDWRCVSATPRRIELRRPATAITLNGIAQGFAADRAADALLEHGIRHALIDTGEVSALGDSADQRPWSVGIQHPRQTDAFVAVARLQGRGLATSGDYATAFSNDLRHHHLFDPRTGRSPGELSSVTVAAPRLMQADALSTAVFVLGAEQGAKLIATTQDVDALFVLKDGRRLHTPGFPLVV